MKVLFGLLLLLFILTETKQSCNYYQNLEVGKTYYAYNPNYPDKTEGEANCRWQMTNPYDVKIDCKIDIPINTYECEQSLSVQFDKKSAQLFCDSGTFTMKGMNPIIKLKSTKYSKGISFLCKIEVEKVLDKNCRCGYKKTTKIVGGNETGVNEYPMMCGLTDNIKKVIYCGCTIICDRYVLTAAHCVKNETYTLEHVGIIVGEHDVSTGKDTNATKLFRVIATNISKEGDIAICKVNDTIQFNAKVGPVCLPFQHSCDSFGGSIVTALGWGLLEFGGHKSDTLQKVNLNVINPKECEDAYSKDNDVNITSKNMCTYTAGKDTCQMDSGGPVLWKNPTTNRLTLVGTISEGYGCASDTPAVNVRVGAFLNWILSHTPGCQFCGIE